VWVHDYHLIPLGKELRYLGAQQRVGFFLHIPWPAAEVLYALPGHRGLAEALFYYDVVGFQSPGDLRSFTDYVVHEGGGEVLPDGRLKCFGKIIDADVFPIGCDADAFAARAESDEARAHTIRMKESHTGREMILGVDRLDYSKGIDGRFRAYATLLERHPDLLRKVFMLQIAPSSRADVPEYQEIRRQLEELSGHINGQFADYDWVPIRYVNRPHSSTALASLYRASRIAFVTPIRDGMNLVAKEFVASQDESDPGVLVLSRFAGAAYQMRSAIIVNPFDEEEMADALHQALMMPLAERVRRWQSLVDGVRTYNVHWWLNSFLERLIAPEPVEAITENVEPLPPREAFQPRFWGRVN
jgi:trehalose 6-phosphate synthase